ncbi:MAG: redoxin domain-containing protein [Pyrinomonadaceae bacterium]
MVRLIQVAACAAVLAALLAGVATYQRRSALFATRLTAAAAGAPAFDGSFFKRDSVLDAKDAPPAPAFAAGTWINSDPLKLETLRGRVVVVDFWTFGCYNCRNTLPSLKRLHDAYASQGLTIVGVHTPELDSERVVANVRREVSSLGLRYPVVTDDDYATWRAYNVEAWPTVFILDRRGRVRYEHVGEGHYEEQERAVKTLLAEEYTDVAK